MRGGDVNTTSGHAYRRVRPAAWLLVIAVVIGISAQGVDESNSKSNSNTKPTQAELCSSSYLTSA